jgi:hypothetical protein
MKKFSFLFCFILVLNGFVKAQETSNTTSTLRMGVFKLKMTAEEIEKAIGQKLKIKKNSDNYADSVVANFENATYLLTFRKRFDKNEIPTNIWELVNVISRNTKLKTKSGMGLGATKALLLATFDKYDLSIINDWNYKDKKVAKDKCQYIHVNDYDAGTVLVFKTTDRIVTSIEIRIQEGDY